MALFWILIVFSISVKIHSQNTSFVFKNYNVKDGLADNNILSMYQDSRGFMWFGTHEGLSRFDGTRFKNYIFNSTDLYSIPGNIVQDMTEYKPGNLVMLCNRKLVFMNTYTDEFNDSSIWKNKYIYAITKAQDSLFYITTTDSTFITKNFTEVLDTIIPPAQYKNTFPIIHTLEKDLWIVGTPNEIFFYNPLKQTYELVFRADEDKKFNQLLSFLYYDRKNHWIYFGSFFDGLFRYSTDGKILNQWTPGFGKGKLPFQHYNFFIPYNNSLFWLGDQRAGLNLVNIFTNEHTHYAASPGDPAALSSDVVTGYYKDREGNHWIATTSGLSKINIISSYIKTWKDELRPFIKDNIITNIIMGPDGNYYFSVSVSHNFYQFNSRSGKIKKYGIIPIQIWYMNSWGNKIVFTGSSRLVYTYDLITKKVNIIRGLEKYFINSDLLVLAYRQKNGNVWLSGNAEGGLVRIDPNGKTYHYTRDGEYGKFSSGYYRSCVEDKNGDLWFGVNKNSKLLHWNSSQNKLFDIDIQSKIKNTTSLNGINDILYDPILNCLWIAYDGSGLIKYSIDTEEVKAYGTKDGLPGNYTYALKFDYKHRLWIASGKGLSCFSIEEEKFVTFDTQNGLAEDNFTYHTLEFDSSTNKICIAGTNSIMQFHVDSILRFSKISYKVYLDKVMVNGKAVHIEEQQSFYFKPNQNNIQFSFVAPDLVNVKKMQYSYMLKGSNSDWVNNDLENTVSFVNLPAGNYSFHLRTRAIGEKEWTEMKQPFHFKILAPWFKTWWFIICMITLAGIILFLVVRFYYQRQFEKKRILLEKELLVEQERTRLAQELHDGLGSMLSGVKHSFSSLKNELDLDSEKIKLYNSNIDKLNASIREIRNISHNLYSHGLGKMSIGDLVEEYCYVKNSEQKIEILFSKHSLKDLILTEEQNFHIFRIIQELLENIIKHSGAKQAIVQLSLNNHVLYITVEDDGKGFDTSRKNKANGIGLKNVETRVRSLYGTLNIKSEINQGTSVFIEIPVK